MTTKIKSLTFVCQQGVSQFIVGNEYEGLLLDMIVDKSIEYPDAFHSAYQGFTKDGSLVFEAINAPIEVRYQKEKEGVVK